MLQYAQKEKGKSFKTITGVMQANFELHDAPYRRETYIMSQITIMIKKFRAAQACLKNCGQGIKAKFGSTGQDAAERAIKSKSITKNIASPYLS